MTNKMILTCTNGCETICYEDENNNVYYMKNDKKVYFIKDKLYRLPSYTECPKCEKGIISSFSYPYNEDTKKKYIKRAEVIKQIDARIKYWEDWIIMHSMDKPKHNEFIVLLKELRGNIESL